MNILHYLKEALFAANNFFWGPPMVILLIGSGLYLQIRLKGMPLRNIIYGFRQVIRARQQQGQSVLGDISPFAALMTSLASAVGTGNIIGVSTAIAIGGPGALFWLVFSAMVCMANKYAEVMLSVHYRENDALGEQVGGPMYAIKNGLRKHWLWMAYAFAIFGTITSFGTGGLVQSNGISHTLQDSFHVPLWGSGLCVMILTGMIILGGIKRIGEVAEKVVPGMCIAYLCCGIFIIIKFHAAIPHSLYLIFYGAFHPMAAVGGFLGSTILMAMHYGVARGIFCNEAGLGTAAIAQSAGKSSNPVNSGIIGMMGTFIDTFIVCLITGLMIILTGAWKEPGLAGEQIATFATKAGFAWGGYFISVELTFFAFTTILAWAYYGERCLYFLCGHKAIRPYRVIYTLIVFVGAVSHLNIVWVIADTMNALMAIPNLISLLLMSPLVIKMTEEYFKQQQGLL